MISCSTSERRLKVAGVPDFVLVALKATWSVPKKDWSVGTIAPAAQLWPDGWSGNGGVTRAGGAATGVAGSNSGSQSGSGSVAGLPSPAASRMAVTGRQKFQWYLSFQQPIAAAAAARFVIANSRALSASPSCRLAASVRKMRLNSTKIGSCQ